VHGVHLSLALATHDVLQRLIRGLSGRSRRRATSSLSSVMSLLKKAHRKEYRASLLDEKCGSILEIGEVEAFSEPIIDGREKLTSFGTSAIIGPKLREARGRA
jgi:hypothetical protein